MTEVRVGAFASEAKERFRLAVDGAVDSFLDAVLEEVQQLVVSASQQTQKTNSPDLLTEVLGLRAQLAEADCALLEMLKGSLSWRSKKSGSSRQRRLSSPTKSLPASIAEMGVSHHATSSRRKLVDTLGSDTVSPSQPSTTTNPSIYTSFNSMHQPNPSIYTSFNSLHQIEIVEQELCAGEAKDSGSCSMSETSESEEEEEEALRQTQMTQLSASEAETQRTSGRRNSKVSISNAHMAAMWGIWYLAERDCESDSCQGFACSVSGGIELTETRNKSSAKVGDAIRGRSCLQHFVIRPNSYYRILWDLLSCSVLAFDIICASFALSFDTEDSTFLNTSDFIIVLFWTIDCVQSFFTGYHDAGIVELRPSHCAKRYFRSWFPFDACLLVMDWGNLMNTFFSSRLAAVFRFGKTVRVARVMRVIRIVRAVKVILFVDSLSENIHSENTRAVVKIMKMMIGIAFMNHFVACGWHMIGTAGSHAHEACWVDFVKEEDDSMSYLYTTSLHWSLTQFTPASMEVRPRNVYERVYTIIVILFALVSFSSFVSTITQAMIHLQTVNRLRVQLQENVDRFITENELSLELGNRINSYIRRTNRNLRNCIHEDDIPQLQSMPISLLTEMRYQVYMPILQHHHVFLHLATYDRYWMTRLCHKYVNQMTVNQGAEVFAQGQKAKRMYFMRSGRAEYTCGENDLHPTVLQAGLHFSEMALWLRWEHKGRVVTNTQCEVVTLSGTGFRQVAPHFANFHCCQEYARLYSQLLHEEGGFSDVWGDLLTTKLLFLQGFGLTTSAVVPDGAGSAPTEATSPFSGVARRLRRLFAGSFSQSQSMSPCESGKSGHS